MIANMTHGGRIALLGLPSEQISDRLRHGGAQHADHQGHLRAGDVRDLVRHVRAGAERLGHLAASSPTASRQRVRERAFDVARSGRRGKSRSSTWAGLRQMYDAACRIGCATELDRASGARASTRASAPIVVAPGAHDPGGRPARCSTSAPTTTWGWPTIRRWSRPRARRSRRLGLRDGLGAVHLRHARHRTRRSSDGSPRSSAPTTRSCTARASTPTADCSRRCSGAEDAVISDELNHARIIDGIRLCKARRLRYRNRDMADLEAQLQEAADARHRMIADRRRVLDGRLPRAAGRDLSPWPTLRRPGDGRRLARRRLRRPERRAARPSCSASGTASTSSPGPWARRSAGPAAATPRPGRDRRAAAPAIAAVPVLQLGRTRDRGRGLAALDLLGRVGRAARAAAATTRPASARG